MDLESAEPASSRRRLLGALGAAGLASAAALTIARPASAAPTSPTDSDMELLRQAMELELAARALYEDAASAGLSDDASMLAAQFARNHSAYADGIAGTAGMSANTRNETVYNDLRRSFTGNQSDFFTAAIGLENSAVATHSALMSEYESTSARELTASIAVVEARMAVLLSELNGDGSDLDALLTPDAQALTLSGEAS